MGSVQGLEQRPQKAEEATVAVPQTNGPAKAAAAAEAAAAASEELVLLAWLIVLLRTREDQQFTFEWAYYRTGGTEAETGEGGGGGGGDKLSRVVRLSASEVVPDLSTRVDRAASAIASRIAASSPRPRTGPISLLLGTGSLSPQGRGSSKGEEEEEANKDEPSLHVEVRLGGGDGGSAVEVRPVWHSEDMLPFTVRRHVENLKETVGQCVSRPEAAVKSLLGPTEHDLEQIWGWNGTVPATYDCCMHEVVSERARRHPDKEAISSFDGRLTYGQVDGYSTALARRLRAELGVRLHDVVPVCFEKSRWTVVAVLAVLKAGATMVMMDPSLPLGRLRNMAGQVGAKVMVSSRKQRGLAESILGISSRIVVVEEETFASVSLETDRAGRTKEGEREEEEEEEEKELPRVPPSTIMYIIFTSGSTGTPKGVQISHRTYSSSAFPRARAVGYAEDWRVLDFASYAFDVSIDSMMLTLANGGCLCIPSDEERLDDINGAMRRMRVNYAGITPSVARILDLDVVDSLRGGLGLGGEAVSARDVDVWGRHARIVIGYGPCECTIGCTVNPSAATGRGYVSIGRGNGAAIWIVDPADHEVLVPVGAVGELLVEGPIVGQGYLGDPEKTAAAFVGAPRWLAAGHGSGSGSGSARYPGRGGPEVRLYKTGDLGRYDPDGSGGIVFVGRKDTQVKLRGQRVELGEIESQLRARLPPETTVIAEVITPSSSLSSSSQAVLVAFVAPRPANAYGQEVALETVRLGPELGAALARADREVAEVLPRYMVPTAYIPVSRIPTLISGKTDRKRLRQFGAGVDLRQMTASAAVAAASTEDRLRHAWARTLRLDPETIGAADNFFALGGDSLAAMRLVSVCREGGLDLSVVKTFSHPTLSAMAAPAEEVIKEAARACGVDVAEVQDMYPCTPTQESLFTFSLKSAEPYVAQRVAAIPAHVSLGAWKRAWEAVVAATPVLRSRLVQIPDRAGLDQVVLAEGIRWRHVTAANGLDRYLEQDRRERMDLGQSLARYAIVEVEVEGEGEGQKQRYMVWTLHHAVYDGWSEPLLLEQVRDALKNDDQDDDDDDDDDNNNNKNKNKKTETGKPTMADFVQFLRETDEAETRAFWRRELQGATGPQFPRVPSRDFVPTADRIAERRVSLPPGAVSALPFTLATLIRAAWALVSSRHTLSGDVVFGETLTGRDVALPGVDAIAGPLIATVPVRVRVPLPRGRRGGAGAGTVASFLASVQRAALARTPFQHMGMQNIRRVSRDAQYACEAPAGLVIQPLPDQDRIAALADLGFGPGDPVREAIHFNPYPLMLACGIEPGGAGGGGGHQHAFRVCASFDGSLLTDDQMGRVLAQLEAACVDLATGDLDRSLDDVSCLPADDLAQIWRWNRDPPLLTPDRATGRLRTDPVAVRPGAVYAPRAVVPWVCDLASPSSRLAPIGCPGELWLEGGFLTGDDVVDSPPWLLAGGPGETAGGRRGKVRPTGDVVELREDGRLVYLGRKDGDGALAFLRGGLGADPAELEAHVSAYLPPSSTRAVAVPVPVPVPVPATTEEEERNDSNSVSRQNLMVLIQHPRTTSPESESEPGSIRILPDDCRVALPEGGFEAVVCAELPLDLAGRLKRLDKYAQNSLASHLVPSAYVVVDKLPATEGGEGEIDRPLLQKLASSIPRQVLDRLREGLEAAWKSSSSNFLPTPQQQQQQQSTTTTTTTTKTNNGTTNTTTTRSPTAVAEDILRNAWAGVLGLDAGQIDVDDNFFRLGGDSVLAMKLVSRLRARGHKLTVADVFRHMRLGDAAKVLKVNSSSSKTDNSSSSSPSSSGDANNNNTTTTNTAAAAPAPGTPASPPPYRPFSMLSSPTTTTTTTAAAAAAATGDPQRFVEEVVRPQLGDPNWAVQDVYPATDSQVLDVRASIRPPRTSVQYTMLYSDPSTGTGFDRPRLLRACAALVAAHDILRTVFVEHASALYQVVIDKAHLDVPVAEVRVAAAADAGAESDHLEHAVRAHCSAHVESEAAFRLGSPMVHFFLVEAEEEEDEEEVGRRRRRGRRECLVICLSHALYDGVSLPALLRDLDGLYTSGAANTPSPTPSAPFSSYLARARAEPARSEALAYWKTLLAGASLSVLPGQTTTTTTATSSSSSRAIFHFNPVPSSSSTTTTTNDDSPVATTATLLTAAWALVLARRLRSPDVTFGAVTSGRAAEAVTVPVAAGGGGDQGDEAEAEAEAAVVAGPCYQLTPVRVPFARGWAAADLLAYVQRQAAESSAHDFVGFSAVAEAVGWTSSSSPSTWTWTNNNTINLDNNGNGNGNDNDNGNNVFFDSIVHHQDWEDFDEMPFAGGRCAVDILNPHGDAARPLKAVSFVRDGRLHVGVVGSEHDAALVDDLLAQLTAAAQQLSVRAGDSAEPLLPDHLFETSRE
ncbi:non-ribosomal peptide synthetase [Thermothelomyces heterothallicus CBS 202.75]|uniref:non-ribosomal peptide synthetase n=1 Tax=Thermothelomyces heterothallicus CBS 202.75 TaxID=1149848 RepID=UPI003741F18B